MYIFLVFEISLLESQSSFCLRTSRKVCLLKKEGAFLGFFVAFPDVRLIAAFTWIQCSIDMFLFGWGFVSKRTRVSWEGRNGRKVNRRKPGSCLVLPRETWCGILCCFTQWLVRGEGKECREKGLKSHTSGISSQQFLLWQKPV